MLLLHLQDRLWCPIVFVASEKLLARSRSVEVVLVHGEKVEQMSCGPVLGGSLVFEDEGHCDVPPVHPVARQESSDCRVTQDHKNLPETIRKGLRQHEHHETTYGCLAVLLFLALFPIVWIKWGFGPAAITVIVGMILLSLIYRR